MKFWNPFSRLISIRYWHAEAIAKKRTHGYLDTRYVYFDAATSEAAAIGLRKIITSQSYNAKFFKPVIEKKTSIRIPIWSAAFWFPKAVPKYMLKKGYINADGH